jgi:ABC-type cobalamin transport system ATPase subunit
MIWCLLTEPMSEMDVIQQAISQHMSQNPESQGQVVVIYSRVVI